MALIKRDHLRTNAFDQDRFDAQLDRLEALIEKASVATSLFANATNKARTAAVAMKKASETSAEKLRNNKRGGW